MDKQRGIQSLDHALKLLKVLSNAREAMSLSELSREAGMPASKAHRYLASFTNAGLAIQRQRSGHYALGPFALELGLSAMDQIDLVNRAADHMADLVGQTGATVLLSIWGTFGPTVIRWERSASMIATSLGLGSTLPLLNSASGKIFLAYLPSSFTKPVLDREIAARRKVGLSDIDVSKSGIANLITTIREVGYATVGSQYIPGLNAVSAPITDWQGEVVAAATLISTDAVLIEAGSAPIQRLLDFCAEQSTPVVKAKSE